MARNELEATEEALRAAQARLGIIGAYLALMSWSNSVGVLNPVATGAEWTAYAVKIVAGMRRRSRRLVQSYYQLARALDAGETLGVPEGDAPTGSVELSRLRQRFLDELLEINTLGRELSDDADEFAQFLHNEALKAGPDGDRDSKRGLPLSKVELDKYIQTFLDYEGDAGSVPVDPFEWPTDTDFGELDRGLSRHLEKKLAELEGSLRELISQKEEDPAPKREEKLREVHEDVGNKLAGEVHKHGLNGGGDTLRNVSNADKRVQVWARQTGPRPCAFCAMLASRGFVYKSRTTATKAYRDRPLASGLMGYSVSAYHPNCACSAISRWESVGENDLPELNAWLMKKWPEVMKNADADGLSPDALNVWRRWLNNQYKTMPGQQELFR